MIDHKGECYSEVDGGDVQGLCSRETWSMERREWRILMMSGKTVCTGELLPT